MKILHYYPDNDEMLAQYVSTLCGAMGLEAVNEAVSDSAEAIRRLGIQHYKVLHLHGCWRNASRRVVAQARRQGTRIVVTPHGQLEPWVMQDWKETLPKRLIYQRDIVQQAHAVIIQGRMEEECMERLKWNPRTIIVRNCLLTSSISARQMAQQTYRIYRRVLDTDPIALMSDDTKRALRSIIKAGITGDSRWVTLLPSANAEGTPAPRPAITTAEEWRLLLLYAAQEHIGDVVQRGIRVLGMEAPDIDTDQSEPFLPAGYQPPVSIDSVIGQQFASENERLVATFRQMRKLVMGRRLTVSHLVELDRELRQHPCEEQALHEQLHERQLLKLAQRMMQLAAEHTGLDEGYMPVAPLDDNATRTIRKQIYNHLSL